MKRPASSRPSTFWIRPLSAVVLTISASRMAYAQSGVWTNPATGGLWSGAGNWAGGIIAEGAGSEADFATLDLLAGNVVAMDAPHTLTSLIFGDADPVTPANWTLSDNADPLNVLTFDPAATITVNALGTDASATISAAIAGSGGLIKAGAGPLNLTGNNLYAGATIVNAGVLTLGPGGVINAGALSTANVAGARYIGNGGSLTSGALSTINNVGAGFLLQSGSATFNANIRTGNADGTVIRIDGGTFSANILDLRRTQAYNNLLTTTDTAQNGLYVTGGSVNIGTLNAGVSNSSVSARIDGGDVTVTGNVNIGASTGGTRYCILQVKGGTFNSTDPVNGVVLGFSTTTANNTQFYLTGGTSTVEKITMGTSALVMGGSGTVYLNGGTLYLGSGGVEKRAGGTYVGNISLISGILGASADWSTSVNLSTGTDAANNAIIKTADATDAPHNISLGGVLSGNSGFTKTGTGTLVLSGNNTYDGSFGVGTVISAGVLQIGAGTDSGTLGTGPVINDSSLVFNRSDALTVDNPITGTGTLTKLGAGVLTLTADNIIAATTVTGGTLSLANSAGSATGSGPVAVQSGASLSGNGTAAGAVTIAAGGRIAPGSGVGTLTTGSLTLAPGSELHFEFNGTPANDRIAVAGALTLNGGAVRLRQENSANPWSALTKYYLIKYSTLGGTGTAALTVSNPVSGIDYVFGTETVGADQFVTLTLSSAGTPDTWNVNADGTWGDPANWSTGIPGGAGKPVNFLGAIATARTITLDGPRTAGSLKFDNGSSYTLTGSPLSFDNSGAAATAAILSGSHSINSDVILAPPGLNTSGTLADASLTLGGAVSGTAAIRHQGPGILRITGANSYDGGTTLGSNGLIEVVGSGNLGTGPLTWNGPGTLRTGANLSLPNNLSITPGTLASFDTAGSGVVASGTVEGAGTLVKTGMGVLSLSNSNSYTGGTLFRGGLVSFTAPANLGSGDLNFDGGGLHWGGGNITDISNRPLIFLPGGATLDTGANNIVLSAPLGGNGTGSLSKLGAGKLTLAAANTYSGPTLVLAGSLAISAADQLGPEPLVLVTRQLILDGGTLLLENTFDLPATSGVAAGPSIGTIDVPTGLTLGISGGIVDRDASPGILDLRGEGMVNLSGNSTWSGGGTFRTLMVNANATNALGTGPITLDGTNLTVGANVFLPNEFIVNSVAVINLSGAAPGSTLTGALNGAGALTVSTGGNRSNVSGDWTGFAGDLILDGGGEWRITGFNETFTNAKVNIAGTTHLVLAVNPNVGVPRIIRLGQLTGTGFLGGQPVPGRFVNWVVGGLNTDSTFEGIITNNMSQPNGVGTAASQFTKEGNGTLTLTGASDYADITTVSAGTLLVNGDNSAATGAVTVTAGTLGGSGIVGGTVTVQPAGSIAPGAAIGTLTTSSTFIEGSLLTEYDAAHANRIDKLVVNGDLTLAPGSQLILQAVGAFPGGAARVIASYSGFLTGTFETVTGLPAGYTLDYAYNDGLTSTNIALVPAFSSPAYLAWATANGLTGGDALSTSDPDGDGQINLLEFALDGNPASAAASGKSRVALTPAGPDNALTITIPVRTGAVFTGTTAQTALIDGMSYTIEGTDDLAGWNSMVISEVSPAASASLPALNPGWTYRTFRTPDGVSTDVRDYLRVKVGPGS